jgi:hypothetical protein
MVLHYVFLNGRNGFFLLKAKSGFLRKSTASYSIGELSTPQTYSSTKEYATFLGNQFGRGYESHSKKDLACFCLKKLCPTFFPVPLCLEILLLGLFLLWFTKKQKDKLAADER